MADGNETHLQSDREQVACELGNALQESEANRWAGVSASLIHRLEALEDALGEFARTDSELGSEFEAEDNRRADPQRIEDELLRSQGLRSSR